MSTSVDNRIVKMEFDNKSFETKTKQTLNTLDKLKASLNFSKETKNLKELQTASNSFDLSKMSSAIDSIAQRFSNLGIVGMNVISNITNGAINMSKRLANMVLVEPISSGLQEYETQIGAVQTILANTQSKGTTLNDVNAALDELNAYADKTIYNFTQMTRNIGTFTAAGVDLETSTNAIKGIANLAAVSGSTSQQASTAMYQLSQALAAGRVSLMDWNSVVNAGMGGELFQNALKRTATVMGTNVDALIEKYGSFRESLTEGQWLTTDVLTETLSQMAGAYSEEDLLAKGYTEEQTKEILQLAKTAEDAATKVKTYSQLIDTTKEALQSGWTTTWEIIFGDFEEAKDLWTGISNSLSEMVGASADARNELLRGGLSSGYKQLLAEGITDEGLFSETIQQVAKDNGIAIEDMISKAGNLEKTFKSGWMTTEMLTDSIVKYTDKILNMSVEEREANGYTAETIEKVKELRKGLDEGTLSVEDFVSKMSANSGRENIISGLSNAVSYLGKIIVPIKEAFRDIFPKTTSDQIYELTQRFYDFTSNLTISDETIDKIKRTFSGLFSVIDIGKTILTSVLKIFSDMLNVIFPLGGNLLDVTASVGDFLVELNDGIKTSDKFNSIINTVSNAFGNLGNNIGKLSSIGSIFGSFVDYISEKMEYLKITLSDGSSSVWDNFKSIFENMTAMDVANLLNAGLFSGLLVIFNKGFGGILSAVKDKISDFSNGTLDGISGILDGVKDSLSAYQNQLNSDVLGKIAKAIAILAASLFVLSLVDGQKLAGSLAALSAMMVELMAALSILSKSATKIKGAMSMIGLMIGMSSSLLILSFAVKNLSSINFTSLVKGILGLGTMMYMLMEVMKTFGNGGTLIKGTSSLIAFSLAILLLIKGIEKLTGIKYTSIAKGLMTIGVLIAGISLSFKYVDYSKTAKGALAIISFGASILILSKAIQMLSGIKYTSIIKGLLAIGSMIGMVSLAFSSGSFAKNSASSGLALIAIASSMLIFSKVIEKLSGIKYTSVAKGLLAIGAILAEVALFSNALGGSKVGGTAVSLIAFSAGVLIFSEAIEKLSTIKWTSLAKSVITIAAALGSFAIISKIANGTAKGSASLLVMATASTILAAALEKLAGIKATSLAKALLTLGGAFAIIGAAGTLLAPVSGSILALSGSIALFGAGMLAIGAGLYLVTTAITLLLASGTSLSTFLNYLIQLIPSVILAIGQGLMQVINLITYNAPAILQMISAILQSILTAIYYVAPQLMNTVVYLLKQLLITISNYLPSIIDAGLNILISLISGISNNIGRIVSVAVDLIANFCSALGENLPILIDAGLKLIVDFINGLADSIKNNAGGFGEAVANLGISVIQGLVNGITGAAGALWDGAGNFFGGLIDGAKNLLGIHSPSTVFAEIGQNVIAGLENGLSGTLNVPETIEAMSNNMLLALQEKVPLFNNMGITIALAFVSGYFSTQPRHIIALTSIFMSMIAIISSYNSKFYSSGVNLGIGFVNGIQSQIQAAANAAYAMAKAASDAANAALDIGSPSKVFAKIGDYTVQGFVKGITDNGYTIGSAITKMGKTTADKLKAMLSGNTLSDLGSMQPVITPVVDLDNVYSAKNELTRTLGSASIGLDPNGNLNSINSMMSSSKDLQINAENANAQTPTQNIVNFVQNNNSPKALSRVDIYRDTKSLLSRTKSNLDRKAPK